MRIVLVLLLLVPSSVRAACGLAEPVVKYTGRTFDVTVCLDQMAACDEEPCYLGATVRRAKDAFQYDLPVKEVRAADLEKPVTLSHKVGRGFVEYQVAVWEGKIKCGNDSKRHGCKTYGYVMEGEAPFFYPEWDFWGDSPWAKIKPSKVQLLESGGGAELVKRAQATLKEHKTTDGGSASNKRDKIEVLYRCAWERNAAWLIAKQLRDAKVGVGWEVKHWPDAPEDFVVAVGAP